MGRVLFIGSQSNLILPTPTQKRRRKALEPV